MPTTLSWHYIPEKNSNLEPNSSLPEITQLWDYRYFLACSVASILDRYTLSDFSLIIEYFWRDKDDFWPDIYHPRVRGKMAMENAWRMEPIGFREAWNGSWIPANCWKLHELRWTPVMKCPLRGRDGCGHPEAGWMYHTLGAGWFIASMLSQKHHNPGPAITKPIQLDNLAGKLRKLIQHFPRTFQPIHRLIQWEEKKMWEKTILPFRRKVSDTLKKHDFIRT